MREAKLPVDPAAQLETVSVDRVGVENRVQRNFLKKGMDFALGCHNYACPRDLYPQRGHYGDHWSKARLHQLCGNVRLDVEVVEDG